MTDMFKTSVQDQIQVRLANDVPASSMANILVPSLIWIAVGSNKSWRYSQNAQETVVFLTDTGTLWQKRLDSCFTSIQSSLTFKDYCSIAWSNCNSKQHRRLHLIEKHAVHDIANAGKKTTLNNCLQDRNLLAHCKTQNQAFQGYLQLDLQGYTRHMLPDSFGPVHPQTKPTRILNLVVSTLHIQGQMQRRGFSY